MDTSMKKLLLALLFLASPVFAQTQTQYYTVPTIAALKAMTTSRPAVVQVVDANPGIFNLSVGACAAADDIFQVQPTGGTTVCYTRAATPYFVGKSATVNGVLVTSGTGVPSVSTTLPAVSGAALLNLPPANAGTAGGTANALTGMVSTHSSLATGQTVSVIAASANTAIAPTLTLTLSGGGTVGPFALTKFGGNALLPNDIFAAGHRLQIIYTGTGFEILNPAISISADSINADNLGIGTADDTAIWNLIDTQIGLNSQLPKKVWVTKQTNVVRFNITNIRQIDGIKNLQTFTLGAAGTTGDWVLRYLGTGPFNLENQTITCPIYDPVTRAQPAGYAAFLVQPSSSSQQNSYISVKHVKTVGCTSGIIIYNSQYTVLEDIFNDRTWSNGWVISDYFTDASNSTRHIRVKDTYGVSTGSYCGSLPAYMPGSALAPVDIIIQNVGCDGAGFIDNKFCFDLTGSAFGNAKFEGWGRNCAVGGMEIKRGAEVAGNVPNALSAVDVTFKYDSNYDAGTGVWWSYETGGSTGPDQYRQARGRLFVTYNPAPARIASTYYTSGEVFQANSNVYKVVTPGATAAGAGPSGITNGITDGTTQVDYLQAVPAAAATINAGLVEALTDADLEYTFYGTAYGVVMLPRGASDGTPRRVNLKLTGTATKYCLSDSSSLPEGPVDRLTVDGSCLSTGDAAIYLGGNTAYVYTNFNLKGGPWVQNSGTGTGTGAIRIGTSASVTGTIAGGVHIAGENRIIYNAGAANLTVGGGGIWDVTYASGSNAIYNTGAAATGTITTGQIYLTSAVTSSLSAYDSWISTSSATTAVYGRFIRGYKSAIPTEHCASGDMFWSQAPGVSSQPAQGWYCSVATGTTWSDINALPATFALANGSLSAMAYGFSGDVTTGMYRPGANILGFGVAGKDALRLAVSGASNNYVSVNSNNTPTVKAVEGSGSNIPIQISGAGTSGVDAMAGGANSYILRMLSSGGTPVNYWTVTSSIATGNVLMATNGSDTNVSATLTAKGSGRFSYASPLRINASNPLEWGKSTDPGTAIGASFCKEYWVAGTGAGTGKKVAYCGTSATPTTIVDNVGGGF